MTRLANRTVGKRALILALLLLLGLAGACGRLGSASPSISVLPVAIGSGDALRVTGVNWTPGERVVIGLASANSPPGESEGVTTVLADAGGCFVTIFALPADSPWQEQPQLRVEARSQDDRRFAQATLDQASASTHTPSSTLTRLPIQVARDRVLGYVLNVVVDASLIKVDPVDGLAETVEVSATTSIRGDGRQLGLADIHPGDLIEAEGYASADGTRRLLATEISILAAVAPVQTSQPSPTLPPFAWDAEYFGNTTFSGNPLLRRKDAAIDFQWQDGPAAAGLPSDMFGVRWRGAWPFEAGAYRFQAQVDDGVRVWLDGHLLLDQWYQSSGALYSAEASLGEGIHEIVVEYFDNLGVAYARFWWEARGQGIPLAFPDWKGEYFDNAGLGGVPFLVVNERMIDFDWGTASPAPGLPSDQFSARWTRTVNAPAGRYRFYARSDDGVRLWIDGQPVIDAWQDRGAMTESAELSLSSGPHLVTVEYYENEGQATAKVWWERLPDTPTATATLTSLPPTATATPTPTVALPTSTAVLATVTPTASPQAAETPAGPEPTTLPGQPNPHAGGYRIHLPQVRIEAHRLTLYSELSAYPGDGWIRARLGGPRRD